MSLELRLKHHKWTSAEPIDLVERIGLIGELRELSFKDLAEVFKRLGLGLSVEISNLLNKLDPTQGP